MDDGVTWLAASAGWTPESSNPFSAAGSFGPTWSCFHLCAAEDEMVRNGRSRSGLYTASFGRRTPHLLQRLGDFLRYEAAQGRSVIVACPEGVSAEALVEEALEPEFSPTAVRPTDPRWLVHSTTREAWSQIQACGELRSAALLGGVDCSPIGELLVGDPPDYAQHVALGTMDAPGPEFVVACRQAGRMLPSPDIEYRPGVRLYFDAHLILRAGLGVRDGLHTLKVRDRLPLEPYLVAKVSVDDLPSLAAGERWTTGLFLQRANAAFADLDHGRSQSEVSADGQPTFIAREH
ncbi:hypothetical protein LLH03_06480 [bacterium]|nr:hypothetical protein [bacterium]